MCVFISTFSVNNLKIDIFQLQLKIHLKKYDRVNECKTIRKKKKRKSDKCDTFDRKTGFISYFAGLSYVFVIFLTAVSSYI